MNIDNLPMQPCDICILLYGTDACVSCINKPE